MRRVSPTTSCPPAEQIRLARVRGLPGDLGRPAMALLGPHPKLEIMPQGLAEPFSKLPLRPPGFMTI